MSQWDTELVRRLRDLHGRGRLTLFVGSGVSAQVGLPTWQGLMGRLAVDLKFDPDVFVAHGTFLQLAEYAVAVRAAHGPVREVMSELFHTPAIEQRRRVSALYDAIASANLRRIYTTNFDQHLERALEERNRPVTVITGLSDLTDTRISTGTQIVHFHGSLADDNSLVLTESDYFRRLRFEHPLDILLRADALQQAFLFVGYSFQDINIRYIWHSMYQMRLDTTDNNTSTRLPSVVTGSGFGEVQKTILNRWGIELFELDPTLTDDSLTMLINTVFGGRP